MEICRERQITPEALLEERLKPLQEKISNSTGELISALSRGYGLSSKMSPRPEHPVLEEIFYAGIITPETKFAVGAEVESMYDFLIGIKNAYHLDLKRRKEDDLRKNERGNFGDPLTTPGNWRLLFMEEPLGAQSIYFPGCFGGIVEMPSRNKPRLELYLGNNESFPFLEETLEGWRYAQLSRLLGHNFLLTGKIYKKIEKEQLKFFDEFKKAEEKYFSLSGERQRKLKIAENPNNPMVDEFVVGLECNEKVRSAKAEVLNSLRKAIKRNYLEDGMNFEREINIGHTETIDMKKFISGKIKDYGL